MFYGKGDEIQLRSADYGPHSNSVNYWGHGVSSSDLLLKFYVPLCDITVSRLNPSVMLTSDIRSPLK